MPDEARAQSARHLLPDLRLRPDGPYRDRAALDRSDAPEAIGERRPLRFHDIERFPVHDVVLAGGTHAGLRLAVA